ncbi:hypothetical protein LWI29_008769 [Acer saccharum]|uniref:RING-type E3 ubiquitin transferase n=1 Tax=Acer saccharum TaxID=4024 RepID=A0AA39VUS2_ACESA|nr:hypothetical protein LWI29_008769 [Acer saccharum]
MNSSTFPFPWLHAFMFSFLLTALSSNPFLSSATPQVSYADHCNSLLPEATIYNFQPAFSSFVQLHTGYYTGQMKTLSQSSSDSSNSLSFRIRNVYKTDRDGVFGIEGHLVLRSSESKFYYVGNVSHSPGYSTASVSFRLHGFRSESSGEVCMVGRGFSFTRQGRHYNPEAVLKLSNLSNSSSVTTLVTGTFESLSSPHDLSYFEPISILIFPGRNYEYTLVSKEFGDEFSGGNDTIVKGLPINSLQGNGFCSVFSRTVYEFNLKYNSSGCISAKNCNPFGDAVGFLPRIVYLKGIDCLEEEKRMRVLVAFPNSSYVGINPRFDPNTAFVGEGFWDDKMNQLCIVACGFSNASKSLVNARVGDCTTRLRLSFPAVWSIRETNTIVGQIWSRKPLNDSGYFNRILFHSSENQMLVVSGLKYEYTEILRAGKLCGLREKPKKKKRERYTDKYSSDMQFDIRVRRKLGNTSWGYATPITVGYRFYQRSMFPIVLSSINPNNSKASANSPITVSYKIGIRLFDKISLSDIISTSSERVEITAEGIYDAETGHLCMVGCRNIESKDDQSLISDSMDCEIVLNFQFPPLKSKKNGGYIKGSITSTRSKPDPLYFERLDVSSASYTSVQVEESISRMDLEIILVLISNTLVCVFMGLQLLHVKQHPPLLPLISLVMLLLLTLGHMIPLVLNFEAMFLNNRDHRKVVLGSGIWLEANEVPVRLVTMVAFLLEFCLLQLTWSARLTDRDQKSLWFAERSAVFVSFPLYIAGALIFLLVNWSKNSLWEDLKSYTGLVLDGFLLPQILLNMFRNSKQDALSCSFYIGTTFVRLLPHVYDLYRRHSYSSAVLYPYIYASPNSNLYSALWDVIILFGGLLFVAIIYLQQRFGGRCIVPWRFVEDEEYEKVPVVSESELTQK